MRRVPLPHGAVPPAPDGKGTHQGGRRPTPPSLFGLLRNALGARPLGHGGVATRLALALSCCLAVAVPAATAGSPPPTPHGPTTVRGSVEQIHVIHAPPGAAVAVSGPATASGVTDHFGGLVLRDLPASAGYRVSVDGVTRTVEVMAETAHPSAAHYAANRMPSRDGYIRVRDGTLLAYRVDLPATRPAGGKYDVVFVYSGYRPALRPGESWDDHVVQKFTALGYAVVGVNMRGTGCSGGAFHLLEPLVALDGYDVVETLSAQPWVEDVAMVGASWLGLSQLYVAAARPPSLDAIAPGAVVGDFYADTIHPGGILNNGFALAWARGRDVTNAYPSSYEGPQALPVGRDPVCLSNQGLRGQNRITADDWAAYDLYDALDGRKPYWPQRNAQVERIQVPTFLVTSWQDEQVASRPATLLERFPKTTPVRLLGTNGVHGAYLEGDIFEEVARFLGVYLRGGDRAAYEREKPVEILIETNDEARARTRIQMSDLQAAGAGRRYLLGADLAADASQSSAGSTFRYDPRPSTWDKIVQDQVRFTSAPLNATTIMAGSGSADLWIWSVGGDVDLQVTVAELRPDGQEQLIQSGWLRASHRALSPLSTPLRPQHLHIAEQPVAPRQWTPLRVEILPFAHVFRAGSRILVTVDGPGGAGNWLAWRFGTKPGGFDVTVGHGASHPSAVVLPVLEQGAFRLTEPLPASLPSCTRTWSQPCRPLPKPDAIAK